MAKQLGLYDQTSYLSILPYDLHNDFLNYCFSDIICTMSFKSISPYFNIQYKINKLRLRIESIPHILNWFAKQFEPILECEYESDYGPSNCFLQKRSEISPNSEYLYTYVHWNTPSTIILKYCEMIAFEYKLRLVYDEYLKYHDMINNLRTRF